MSLRLYDTGARVVRDFEPLVEGQVGLYLCGATVQAPEGDGSRLIPDVIAGSLRSSEAPTRTVDVAAKAEKPGEDAEIRLTYRELSALIEDAIRNLR